MIAMWFACKKRVHPYLANLSVGPIARSYRPSGTGWPRLSKEKGDVMRFTLSRLISSSAKKPNPTLHDRQKQTTTTNKQKRMRDSSTTMTITMKGIPNNLFANDFLHFLSRPSKKMERKRLGCGVARKKKIRQLFLLDPCLPAPQESKRAQRIKCQMPFAIEKDPYSLQDLSKRRKSRQRGGKEGRCAASANRPRGLCCAAKELQWQSCSFLFFAHFRLMSLASRL